MTTQKFCPQCTENQDSVYMWMIHLAQSHPLPSEWLSDKAKMLKDDENQKPYTVVTDSRKRRRRPTTPRPLNTFMIFSRHIRRNILSVFPDASNSELSKELGMIWKKISPDIKSHYEEEAKRLVRLHQQEFPDYKYQPKKRCKRNSSDRLYYEQSIDSPPPLLHTPSSANCSNRRTHQPLGNNLASASPTPSTNTSGSTEEENRSYYSYRSSTHREHAKENQHHQNHHNHQAQQQTHNLHEACATIHNISGSSPNGGQINAVNIENQYIRYSILGKNVVKRECQSFGSSPLKRDQNNFLIKKECSTTGIFANIHNNSNNTNNNHNNHSHNNSNNNTSSNIILQSLPTKPLNVRITNIDSNFFIRPKFTTTTTSQSSNIYLITDENNHSSIGQLALVSTAIPLNNNNNSPHSHTSSCASMKIHDLSMHATNNNNHNNRITTSKDLCLINNIYPENNLDEDIDITGNLFSNDLEIDWEDLDPDQEEASCLDSPHKHDLPNLNSLFHH